MSSIENKNDELPLEIEKSYIGNKLALYIKGRIDTQTAPEFQKYLDDFFSDLDGDLTFDFGEVEYLSSAGLRTILYAKKKIESLDKELSFSIVNVNPSVMEVFEMTGFTDIIDIVAK